MGRIVGWVVPFVVLALHGPASASPAACTPATAPDAPCACDLAKLRPLQGGVGFDEVADKLAKLVKHPERASLDSPGEAIEVAVGPDGNFYITDHHHGGLAWLQYRMQTHVAPIGVCSIRRLDPAADMAAFHKQLEARKLVHLEDANGVAISWEQLPPSLAAMPNDPYRSLAGALRDKSWCRNQGAVEFAEFDWADYLRGQQVGAKDIKAADKAVRDCKAADLPGFIGDTPPGFTCPASGAPPRNAACP